jgi:probable DNA metabolism protein
MNHTEQRELFEEPKPRKQEILSTPPDLAGIFELSVEAFYAALYARMSEFPIEGEISRYIDKVRKTGGASNDRKAAAEAASDRGDPDVFTVLKAAGKVQHEIHRLIGLLRFSPAPGGVYTAHCSPDHFILPALAEHFTLRFGDTPWAIIDEKRSLCLYRAPGGQARLIPLSSFITAFAAEAESESSDAWEDLWRLYYRSVNNEARQNLALLRQFMPERYWKYLSEMKIIPSR